MNVLITNTKEKYFKYGSAGREMLEQQGYTLLYNETGLKKIPAPMLYEMLPEIDAAIVTNDRCDAEFFRHAPKLKILAKYGVGVDNIDCEAAKAHGVKVITAKSGNSQAVAELAVTLILNVLRQVPLDDAKTKAQGWYRLMGEELRGKTVGLLGFGDIGRRVAKMLGGFDVELLAYDPYPDRAAAEALKVRLVSSSELLSKSRIVSLHIPLLLQTQHFIDRAALAQMRPGAYLINTARGGLVDTQALCDALDSGALAGAALDVYEVEPLSPSDRVLHTPNLITLSHLGAETAQAYAEISRMCAKGIIDGLNGGIPANWVNP